MSPAETKASKLCQPWPAQTLVQRLIACRIMLYVHGILSDAEKDRADKRIDKLEAACGK